LVESFFADKITPEEFKQELAREKVKLRAKERRLPKARGKIYS